MIYTNVDNVVLHETYEFYPFYVANNLFINHHLQLKHQL